MKNKKLIYILALLVFVAPACQKHKRTIEGYVRDIGTKAPLAGIVVSVVRNNGSQETTDAFVSTDKNGYFKFNYDKVNGFTNYELRCKDPNQSNATWFWVDVNKKSNPYGVKNSGEQIDVSIKNQTQEMWMGRYAEFDSLIFHTGVPFIKGDEVDIDITDTFLFSNTGSWISLGNIPSHNVDTLYDFNYRGTLIKSILANSDNVFIKLSGTKQGKPYYYQETLICPIDNKRVLKKNLP